MKFRRLVFVGVAVLGLGGGLAACGGGDDEVLTTRGGKVEPLDDIKLPEQLVGLEVTEEKVDTALEQFRPSYVAGAALYAFRGEKDIVQATFQVARFRDDEENQSSDFRQSILAQFGSTRPRATLMGDTTVYRTTQTKQTVALWFEGRDWFLLSIRDEFEQPRTLLRETLEVTTK